MNEKRINESNWFYELSEKYLHIYIYIYIYIYICVCVCVCVCVCIYPAPPARAGCKTRSFFKWSKPVWIQSFFFIWLQKKSSVFYYLSLARIRGRVGSMLFLRVLAPRETQIASSRIWTRISDSISNDDYRYAKRALYMYASMCMCVRVYIWIYTYAYVWANIYIYIYILNVTLSNVNKWRY